MNDLRHMDNEILQRITALETLTTAKWDAHDKASIERSVDIKAQLTCLSTKMDSMKQDCVKRPPICLEIIEKKLGGRMKMYVGLALGIPGLLLVLITFWKEIH